MVQHKTGYQKVAPSITGRSGGEISPPELTFCTNSHFGICHTPTHPLLPVLLPQQHMKDWPLCQKCSLQVTLCYPRPNGQCGMTMLARHNVGTHQENMLTCNSAGNTDPQLFQVAEPLWADPWLQLNGIGACKLFSMAKTKKVLVENDLPNLPSQSLHAGKKKHTMNKPEHINVQAKASVTNVKQNDPPDQNHKRSQKDDHKPIKPHLISRVTLCKFLLMRSCGLANMEWNKWNTGCSETVNFFFFFLSLKNCVLNIMQKLSCHQSCKCLGDIGCLVVF